jgi:Flp pilus assembly protein TadG
MTRSSHSVRSGVYDERGAVVPIIALSLIALLGMVVLVVDVGGLLYRKRQMVSASDAGALAAARSCVEGTAAAGSPGAQADTYAQANVEGIPVTGGIIEQVGCETGGEGYVTVEYTSTQNFSFAGIFGSSSGEVPARATAEWGAAASANPMPFIVSLGASGDNANVFCKDAEGNQVLIDPDTPLGTSCYVWFDNGSNGGSFGGFGESVFGSLNLDRWGVGAGDSCSSTSALPNNTSYAYNGGYHGDMAPLNYPNPTWVCTMSGNQDSLFGANGASNVVGQILVFPVTDAQVILDSAGKIEKFNVVGFVALRLDAVYDANQAGGTTVPCGSLTDQTITPTTPDFDLNARSTASGCAPFDDVVNVRANGTNPCCQEGTHYTFDQNTHILDWTANTTYTNVSVSWDVFRTGPCGPKPSNASGHCMAVSWQGIQFGNGPLGGLNLGVPAIRLCDLTIAGSCDTAS